jgi:hypothetical protein
VSLQLAILEIGTVLGNWTGKDETTTEAITRLFSLSLPTSKSNVRFQQNYFFFKLDTASSFQFLYFSSTQSVQFGGGLRWYRCPGRGQAGARPERLIKCFDTTRTASMGCLLFLLSLSLSLMLLSLSIELFVSSLLPMSTSLWMHVTGISSTVS